MLKGKKLASKTNTPTVKDSTSSEEDNPSVAVEEIQKSASPTTRSKSALKDSTPISSPTPSVPAEEIRKSTGPKTRSKRSLEDSTSDSVPETSNTSPTKKKSKTSKTSNPPKRLQILQSLQSLQHLLREKKLEKQKESPFWPILDVFVHKKAEMKEEENLEKKKENKRDMWFKSTESIFKIVNQFRHDNSGNNVSVFNTAEEKKFVEYWFVEHNNNMTPSNEQGFPRFLRWVISDISNTIEKDIGEAMKKMQPGWVKAWSDKYQQIIEEYRKNSLLASLKKKNKKIYAANLKNVQKDKDVVDLVVYSLQEIISFNKELKTEDERDDDEQEEEEGEKGEKSGKGDVDDSDDDDDEEGDKGNISGKYGDVDDSDKEQEGDEEEEDGGGKGGDEEQDEEDGGGKGGDEEQDEDNGGGKGGDMHDDDEQGGGKGGDMHGDDTEKEGGKGGDDEGGQSEKRSTPLSKTNEEKDGKDGTRQGVESGAVKNPRDSCISRNQDATQTDEIDPKGMFPVEEELLLLTHGEDQQIDPYTSIEDLLDNLSESVFIKLEKGFTERHHLT
ncbi:nucleolar transcription factor 1-like [Papaver somniferum]|uniref:nucleolar transcription factor 1-like n=1 Tax=Papaver somniferum TaxID=3469 RepID=UPI000E6F6BD7|nr:nucleolar transcription factor 1-like [Papaver somniferum]